MEDRFAFHPGGRFDAEQVERGGRQVFDAGILGVDLAIGEKHARDEHRIDAMVAAPGLGVVLEHARRDLADRGFPEVR